MVVIKVGVDGWRVMEVKWGNGGYGGNEDYDIMVWWL